MESIWILDAPGRASIPPVIHASLVFLLLSSGALAAQVSATAPAGSHLLHTMRALDTAQPSEEIAELPIAPEALAEAEFYRGLAFARLHRWADARRALLAGERRSPHDKRFPEELAGVAFKSGDLPEARRQLRRALQLDPGDEYADDFLATLYILQDNLDAALKYWNRIGKPGIGALRLEPPPRIDPVLLDRAFAFAPHSELRLPDLLATRARLDALGVFRRYQIELAPARGAAPGGLDAVFQSEEKRGWRVSWWRGLVPLLGGLPYETVYPEWFNIRNSAVNLTSLVRWDPQKRRAALELAGPWGTCGRWRYHVSIDGRDENWTLSPAFYGPGPALNNLKLESLRAGGGLRFIASGRWSFDTGVEVSQRRFARLPAGFYSSGSPSAGDGAIFRSGFELVDYFEVRHEMLRVPERRLTIESSLRGEFGKFFAAGTGPFAQLRASATADWRPGDGGGRNDFRQELRTGKTFGAVPFDELFMLGLERDNGLWLRGHAGTSNGRKGAAPMGREFVLTNAGYRRAVWQNGLVKLSLGPFLDSGSVSDPSGLFGSRAWLWDPGIEVTLSVLGSTEIRFVFGRDLRGGRNAIYGTAVP